MCTRTQKEKSPKITALRAKLSVWHVKNHRGGRNPPPPASRRVKSWKISETQSKVRGYIWILYGGTRPFIHTAQGQVGQLTLSISASADLNQSTIFCSKPMPFGQGRSKGSWPNIPPACADLRTSGQVCAPSVGRRLLHLQNGAEFIEQTGILDIMH